MLGVDFGETTEVGVGIAFGEWEEVAIGLGTLFSSDAAGDKFILIVGLEKLKFVTFR